MQDSPGAPGTARQGRTRTIMLVKSGGVATQPRAPGTDVPLATTARAPGQYCLSAALRALGQRCPRPTPRAPGHDNRTAAPSSAPGRDRPRAASRALGQRCPRPTPRAPGHDNRTAAPSSALGHDRPRAASRAPDRKRSRLAPRAPGHGSPLAAPSAVDYHWSCTRHRWVPAHGRFPTAQRAARHDRPRATPRAPGHDNRTVAPSSALGHDRPRVGLIATVPLPAGLRRLRQGVLPRVPCQSPHPDLPAFPPSHPSFPRKRESMSPRSNGGTTGGPRTGHPHLVIAAQATIQPPAL